MKEHDVVQLTKTLFEGELEVGLTGTVVHTYPNGTHAVEFDCEDGPLVIDVEESKLKVVEEEHDRAQTV